MSSHPEYELSKKRVELKVLEEELDADELWEHSEYQRLKQEVRELEKRVESEESAHGQVKTEPLTVEENTDN